MNNFNFIAPFYDKLASLVFGNTLFESQIYFLTEIKASYKVLIIGGGSGKLLTKISNCESITFLEKSEKMIGLAKKINSNKSIIWLNEDFLRCNLAKKFDLIICPFFLDAFDEGNLEIVISKIKNLLFEDGKLIVTDFQITKKWHSILVKLMYLFFRILTNYNGKKLINFSDYLVRQGFSIDKKKSFYSENIFSGVFR